MGFKCRPVVGSRAKTVQCRLAGGQTWASMTVENVPLSGWGFPNGIVFPGCDVGVGCPGRCVFRCRSRSRSRCWMWGCDPLRSIVLQIGRNHPQLDATKSLQRHIRSKFQLFRPIRPTRHDPPAVTHPFQVPDVPPRHTTCLSNKAHPPRPIRSKFRLFLRVPKSI
jgi:hypothetical protein